MRLRIIALAFLPGLIVGGAAAQGPVPPVAEVAARVQGEVRCIEAERAELAIIARLLIEARQQMAAPTAHEAERRDAARSALALEDRVAAAGGAIAACVEAGRRARREAEEAREEIRAADAEIAEPRSSLDSRAVSGPEALNRTVQVVRGLQVDGMGRIDPEAVNRAVRRVGGAFARCYASLVDEGAFTTGELDVTFHVTPSGRTLGHEVEGSTITDEAFGQCVLRVARRIDVQATAVGGDARYSYTFHFGPR
jgi:TonB family protein